MSVVDGRVERRNDDGHVVRTCTKCATQTVDDPRPCWWCAYERENGPRGSLINYDLRELWPELAELRARRRRPVVIGPRYPSRFILVGVVLAVLAALAVAPRLAELAAWWLR